MAEPIPATTGQMDSIQPAAPRPVVRPPGRVDASTDGVRSAPAPRPAPAPQPARAVREVPPEPDRSDLMNRVGAWRKSRQRERMATQAALGTLKPPRPWVYYPLIVLAVTADIIGIFAQVVNLTGIGAFAVSAISICLSLFFLIVGIIINRKVTASRRVGEGITLELATMQRRVRILRQRVAGLIRAGRRIPGGRALMRTKYGRTAIVTVSKWLRTMTRGMRYAQVILEAIPFVNLLPWYTINMLLAYREHQKEYRAALAVAAEYPSMAQEEDVAFAQSVAAETA